MIAQLGISAGGDWSKEIDAALTGTLVAPLSDSAGLFVAGEATGDEWKIEAGLNWRF